MTFECKRCGKEFKRFPPKNKIPKYCSLKCRNEGYIKNTVFSCEWCKKEFFDSVRDLSGKNRFCSQKCVNEWKKEAYKEKRVEYVFIECDYCGKKMERVPSKVNKKNYCNKSCKGKYFWEKISKKMVWKPCHGVIKGQKMFFRSRWELVFAIDFLEKSNLKWEYEPKSFTLSDGSKYTPDFYIEDDGVWVEVKGYDKSGSSKRFFAFREQYPEENTIFANEYVLKSVYGLNLDYNYLKSICSEGQDS